MGGGKHSKCPWNNIWKFEHTLFSITEYYLNVSYLIFWVEGVDTTYFFWVPEIIYLTGCQCLGPPFNVSTLLGEDVKIKF